MVNGQIFTGQMLTGQGSHRQALPEQDPERLHAPPARPRILVKCFMVKCLMVKCSMVKCLLVKGQIAKHSRSKAPSASTLLPRGNAS